MAEKDGELIGFIEWIQKSGFRKEVVLELEQLAVQPGFQGQGIGTALSKESLVQMDRLLKQRNARIKSVMVTTPTDNQAQGSINLVSRARSMKKLNNWRVILQRLPRFWQAQFLWLMSRFLNSYDDRWSIHAQRHHKDFDYVKHFTHYCRALCARNIATDVLSVDAALDGYKLVIAPALLMLNENRAAALKSFVENGGHLVLPLRSGMKDDYNALLPLRQPGMLAEIAGVEVEEYYALFESVPVVGDNFRGESRIWAERLKVKDEATKIIARYGESNGWLDGQAAVTIHSFGKGTLTYVGAWLDDTSLQKLIDEVVKSADVLPVLECPAGVS